MNDRPENPDTPQPGPHDVDAHRALIVDRDERSASHFRATLDAMNVHTLTVDSPSQALRVAREEPPHLLVAALPVDDAGPGIDLAMALRIESATASVFIVDRLDEATLKRAADVNPHGLLCRPVHRDQLETTFLLALEQQRRERTAEIRATLSATYFKMNELAHSMGTIERACRRALKRLHTADDGNLEQTLALWSASVRAREALEHAGDVTALLIGLARYLRTKPA